MSNKHERFLSPGASLQTNPFDKPSFPPKGFSLGVLVDMFFQFATIFYSSLREVIDTVEEKLVGIIRHFYSKISVAVLELSDTLRVGDTIRITGKTNTDFTQIVESMEIEHKKIEEANPGNSIGLKVSQKVREGCCVYKL